MAISHGSLVKTEWVLKTKDDSLEENGVIDDVYRIIYEEHLTWLHKAIERR